MFCHEAHLRVRYAETDQMGIAHHSQFLLWMEVARADFLREVGYRYRDIEAKGFFMAVSGVDVKYYYPARYDDMLKVKTWIGRLSRVRMDFLYDIINEEDKRVARGTTTLACIGKDHRPTRMPLDVFEALKKTTL